MWLVIMNKLIESNSELKCVLFEKLILLATLTFGLISSFNTLASSANDNGLVNQRLSNIAIYDLGDAQCKNLPSNLSNINFANPNVSGYQVSNYIANDFAIRSSSNSNCGKTFADSFAGDVYIPADENVTFYLNSEDGSKLWINGNLVVNNDGVHNAQENNGSVALSHGWHFIEVQYFHNGGADNADSSYSLDVSYSSNGIGAKQGIPNSALRLGAALDTDNDGVANYYDIDKDGDGLIEISTLADLDEVRNNLTGTALFGNSTGCNTGCNGFELTQDLDFDTSGDGIVDANDANGVYWNAGEGWLPIGRTSSNAFQTTFEGNNFTINNLTINRSIEDGIGFFGFTRAGSIINNFGLTHTRVEGNNGVGALVGKADNSVVNNVYSTGKVSGNYEVGGLIGWANTVSITTARHIGYITGVDEFIGGIVGRAGINSAIENAFNIGSVVGGDRVGGIAGTSDSDISDVYVAGYVNGDQRVGGITSGVNSAHIDRSYVVAKITGNFDTGAILGSIFAPDAGISSSYWLTGIAETAVFYDRNVPIAITAANLVDLSCPTNAGDNACNQIFYADWDDSTPVWQFGTNNQLPALMQNASAYFLADFDGDGVSDQVDVFPSIALGALLDNDSDGIPDNCDAACLSTGLDTDTDDDNDGVDDVSDAFPFDSTESADNDLDGIGDNADLDDDNDGVNDDQDEFPFDASESADIDGDGIGDNADNDSDNDGYIDSKDSAPLNPLLPGLRPIRQQSADNADNRFAYSIANVGDVDGDGVDDIVTGAFEDSANGFDDNGVVFIISAKTGKTLYKIYGDGTDNELGKYIRSAPDMDNDNVNDFLVYRAGRGEDTNNAIELYSSRTGSLIYSISSEHDVFGHDFTFTGDVNNDGVDDLLISAPGFDNDQTNAGAVFIYSGVDGSELSRIEGSGGYFGDKLVPIGDINADQITDFIVSASSFDAQAGEDGRIYVFSGADNQILYQIDGDEYRQKIGDELVAIDDINNDGIRDFAYSNNTTAEFQGQQRGFISLVSGADGSQINQLSADGFGLGDFGKHLYSVKDIDGDGSNELVVIDAGNINEEHNTNVIFYSLSKNRIIGRVYSDNLFASSSFAQTLAVIDDITGDNFPEIVVGDYGHQGQASATGAIFTYSFGDFVIDTDNDGTVNGDDADIDNDGVTNFNDAYPYISVAGLTDTDLDGIPDTCDNLCQQSGMAADNYINGIIYVDNSSSCNAENETCGQNWQSAFRTLQDALLASNANQQIWVSEGVYYPSDVDNNPYQNIYITFKLPTNVSIFGGFNATDLPTQLNEANPELFKTVLSGDIDFQTNPDVTDDQGITQNVSDILGNNASTLIFTALDSQNYTISGVTLTGADRMNSSQYVLNISRGNATIKQVDIIGSKSSIRLNINDNCQIDFSYINLVNISTSSPLIKIFDTRCSQVTISEFTTSNAVTSDNVIDIRYAENNIEFNRLSIINDNPSTDGILYSNSDYQNLNITVNDSVFFNLGSLHSKSILNINNSIFMQTHGIKQTEDFPLTVKHSSFINNQSTNDAGAVSSVSTNNNLGFNLFVGNTGQKANNIYVENSVNDLGYNLVGANSIDGFASQSGNTFAQVFDSGTSFVATQSIEQITEQELANNGGDMLSALPIAEGPAVDIIPVNECLLPLDIRGEVRPQASLCDIGAVEFSDIDTDGDGIKDSVDTDDDGDGVDDVSDAFPLDATESVDTDLDGIGNNADTDDDNDGYSDSDELANGTDPLLNNSTPSDSDLDLISDLNDICPVAYNPDQADIDTDNIGDVCDDSDNDGSTDSEELAAGTLHNDANQRPYWWKTITARLGESAFFGGSLTSAGDVNKDGHDDIIIGARNGDNSAGVSVGIAQVFSGINGELLYQFEGEQSSDSFGYSVNGAGDVNKDGFYDVIIGAYKNDANGNAAGAAYVYSGIDGALLYHFKGESAYQYFGRAVSSAGDVNDDGYDDVVVGAPWDKYNWGSGQSYVKVFSGIDGSLLFKIDGFNDFDQFGLHVSQLGDVNGDDKDDFLIGSKHHTVDGDPSGNSSGTVRLYSGADANILYTLTGEDSNDKFPYSIKAADDFNQDNIVDFLVGTHGSADKAILYSGLDGTKINEFIGSDGTSYGREAASIGDINADGSPDIMVGASYTNDGDGAVHFYNGNSYQELFKIEGGFEHGQGQYLSSAGDLDKDGERDALISHIGYDNYAGMVRVLLTKDLQNDVDLDTWLSSADNCINVANSDQANSDGDALGDACDAFINDASEWLDSDGDGVGDNTDQLPFDPTDTIDSDGDGVGDSSDAFPNDPNESVDTDGDGVGNNADTDDDQDGISDVVEQQLGLDSLQASDGFTDLDNDYVILTDELALGTDPNDAQSVIKPLTQSFGNMGVTQLNYDDNFSTEDEAYGITALRNGQFLMLGYSVINTNDHLTIARINQNGTLDTTFAEQGYFTSQDLDYEVTVTELLDGSLIVTDNSSAFMKLSKDGNQDVSFANNGILDFLAGDDAGVSVNYSATTLLFAYQESNNVKLAKTDLQGNLLNGFGNNGIAEVNVGGSGKELAKTIMVQDDGTIVVSVATSKKSYLFKLDSTGNLDTNFATNGVFEYSSSSYSYLHMNSGLITAKQRTDGNFILLVENSINDLARQELVQVTANGQLDTSWAEQGVVGLESGRSSASVKTYLRNFSILTNDQLLVTGRVFSLNDDDYIISALKLNADGSRDVNYFNNGLSRARLADNVRFYGNNVIGNNDVVFVGTALADTGFQEFYIASLDNFIDMNNDGNEDVSDSFDTDLDGIGDNVDPDDDNDGVNDDQDAFPLDVSESLDTDLDGIGDNADLDDDNDGFSDIDESIAGTSPNDANDIPADVDGDFISDANDIDNNNNDLIDINSWSDLNQIRNNLDGLSLNNKNLGCPNGCKGFELLTDLDFDTSGNGVVDANDDYWDEGRGWHPIGESYEALETIFEGNDHTISNLYINRPNEDYIGLIAYVNNQGIVRNLTLDNVRITGKDAVGGLVGLTSESYFDSIAVIGRVDGENRVGGIAGGMSGQNTHAAFGLTNSYHIGRVTASNGFSGGVVAHSHAGLLNVFHIGPVHGGNTVGGIAAYSAYGIVNAYSAGEVVGTGWAGGIAATAYDSPLENVYSVAKVIGVGSSVGALFGRETSVEGVKNGYWFNEHSVVGLGVSNVGDNTQGLSLEGLSCPQQAGDFNCTSVAYNNWDDTTPIWRFGSSNQLPSLLINGNSYQLGDFDNDGVDDLIDLFPSITITGFTDSDGDGAPDDCDTDCQATGLLADEDDDNDGVSDLDEAGNTAPIITEQSPYLVNMDENGSPTAFSLTLNATDIDNDTLTWSVATLAENGVASVSGDGLSKAITYTPDNNFHGSDNFDVQVNDNAGGSAIITINVTVNATIDTDGDGIINALDSDDDNDGYPDGNDDFPLDSTEWLDTDNDGIGNNSDIDDDNDGISDMLDVFPLNAAESIDTDFDGIGNNADIDDDNDGVSDNIDAFPFDATESVDTDGDGIGNNADLDDDGDGFNDDVDAAPLDSNVFDITPPVLSIANSIAVAAVDSNGTPATNSNISLFLSSANAVDGLEGVVSVSHDAPEVFNIGATPVTFSASDSSGNITTLTATVSISDQTEPVISLTGNTAITLSLNDTFTEPGYIAIDNVDGDISQNVNVTGVVDTSIIGTVTLNYNVTDNEGNTAQTKSRQVTIQDAAAPVIIAPSNIVVAADDSSGVPVTNTDIASFLNAANGSDDVDINVDIHHDAPQVLPLGITTITFSATDSANNVGSSQATVDVQDLTAPVIQLTGNSSVTLSLNASYIEPGYLALDNVDGDISDSVDVSGSVNTSIVGTYTLVYTISDNAENVAIQQNRQVTVQDAAAPVIITPVNITVAAVNATGTPVSNQLIQNFLQEANAIDDVDEELTVDNDAPGLFSLGVNTITFSAVDSAGNIGTARATVTVSDLNAPQINLLGNSSLVLSFGETYQEAGYTAIDNVDGDLVDKVVVVGSVDNTAIGTYTINYDVQDNEGNQALTLQRKVTVQDAQAPVIQAPDNIIVAAINGAGTTRGDSAITSFLNEVTATDDVDLALTIVNDAPGVFSLGTTIVEFSATDSSGNIGSAQATISVIDQAVPVITLVTPTELVLNVGATFIEPGYSATDNVDGNISDDVILSGGVDTSQVGNYLLHYNVSDKGGNAAITVSRAIVVQNANLVDSDGDGVVDVEDAFPEDASEWLDTDGDGIGNNADTDDDGDGADDTADAFPLDSTESMDSDGDGIGNNADTDDDGDDVDDAADAFPLDSTESMDTDGDGIGNNADTDDDGDGVDDAADAFPLDSTESMDTDGDGIGNNADTDDDGDGVDDAADAFPLDSTESMDTDGDGIGNNADTDDDGDGVDDAADAFPLDSTESMDTDGDGTGNNADTDDDGDGVDDAADAFPLDSTESVDTDGDGTGNNADTDDDNDGVDDTADAFPLDSTESMDTDGDGIGNNADTDDDNDGILDEDDDEPLTPYVDTEPPVFSEIAQIIIEATGELTSVSLEEPEVSDNDGQMPALVNDITEALPLGVHQVRWTATDTSGNESTIDQQIIITDTTAPEFINVQPYEMNALGRLTQLDNIDSVTATDIVDGIVPAFLLDDSPLLSGSHSVAMTAFDLSGNEAEGNITVFIYPEVTLSPTLTVEAGGSYALGITLSGTAPLYPVFLSYRLMKNSVEVNSSSLEMSSGAQANLSFTVPADALVSDNFEIVLSSSQNAFLGNNHTAQLTIIESNVAPQLTLTTMQNGMVVSVVDPDNGNVTLLARVDDVNQSDSHDVAWRDSNADFNDADNVLSYDINPSTLTEGVYSIDVTATENNTNDQLSVTKTVQFVVEQLTELDDEVDSDNDGIVDSEEGYSDSDGDGIADYLDDDNNTTRLPSSENTEPLQTSPGLTMSLGTLASSQGSDSSNASLTVEELSELVGENAADTSDSQFEVASPLYNFTIAGAIEQGQSIAVVIPLAEGSSLPEDAVYRKYNVVNGWFNFVEDVHNHVSSAQADSNGNCPAANDASFAAGLTQGDNCIQLVIEDGGPNDADFMVNGSIEDPGAIAVETINLAPVITLPTTYQIDEEQELVVEASVTDAEGDVLTYHWSQLSGISVELSQDNQAQVSFIAPEVMFDEILIFELAVNDGVNNITSTTEVTVKQVNQAPVIATMSHQSQVNESDSIMLDVEATDADGDTLMYSWQQLTGPEVSFDQLTSSQVNISVPEVSSDQMVEVEVTVTDGQFERSYTTTFIVKNVVENITVTPPKQSSGGTISGLLLLLLMGKLRKQLKQAA